MDDVLYGLERGSMMPTLMGSPVFAGSAFAGSSAEARYMPLVAPSARRPSSPDASAPPVSAESCRNRLREIPLMSLLLCRPSHRGQSFFSPDMGAVEDTIRRLHARFSVRAYSRERVVMSRGWEVRK